MARALENYIRPDAPRTPFCPGCGHGILMNLTLRTIKKMGLDMDRMLFVSGIGCAGWIPSPHFNADTLHTLHGRAVAYATGAKLYNPDLITMVISGDGDLTSIGGNHLIHAARRDIDLTVICANNMIYGMTGGQMASTTPLGSTTATSLKGNPYRPFDLVMLMQGAGARYVARYSVTQPQALMNSIEKALTIQGFAFIEVLSNCPTQFGRRNLLGGPVEMLKFLKKTCVTREKAARTSPEELKDKIITGEWAND